MSPTTPPNKDAGEVEVKFERWSTFVTLNTGTSPGSEGSLLVFTKFFPGGAAKMTLAQTCCMNKRRYNDVHFSCEDISLLK